MLQREIKTGDKIDMRAGRVGITILEDREDLSEEMTFEQILRVKPVCYDPSLRKFGESPPGSRSSKCKGPEGGTGWGVRSREESGRR